MPRPAAAALIAAFALVAPAQAATVRVADAKCVPAEHCQTGKPRYVAPGGKLVLTGTGLTRGQAVLFPRKSNRKKFITAKLRKSRAGLVVVVPLAAGSGRIRVLDRSGRKSNAYGPIHVVKPASPVSGPPPSGTVLDGSGMWIWYLNKSEGGDLDAITARANAAGVKTVFI